MSGPTIGGVIPTRAQWNWSVTPGQQPVVNSYPTTNGPTKSGVTPDQLRSYIMIPIQMYGTPPVPVPNDVITQWIRWAEDEIEVDTNIRLCQTWIAAPPSKSDINTQILQLGTQYGYQQLGIDYDYAEAPYDFFFERAKDEAWLYQRLRWRPVKGVETIQPAQSFDESNFSGVKNLAFIYPLLNEFFRIPPQWYVEDQNRGLIRIVPATNVQMLPLWAMQLAFLGFAQSVPGGMWFQYTAGLTAYDYQASWSFMTQLVLAKAAATALGVIQLSINMGAIETLTQADGLSLRTKYSEKGPFSGQIAMQQDIAKKLTTRAKMMGGGIHLGVL